MFKNIEKVKKAQLLHINVIMVLAAIFLIFGCTMFFVSGGNFSNDAPDWFRWIITIYWGISLFISIIGAMEEAFINGYKQCLSEKENK